MEHETQPAPPITQQAHATTVAEVERQLARLWKQLVATAGYHTLIRAHTLNLVAYTNSDEECERVTKALASLVQAHPARSIILCAHPQATSTLDANITTQCQTVSSHHICYEQIHLNISDLIAAHLAALVQPLLVSHLPTYLWWIGMPPIATQRFRNLLSICERLIVDSLDFPDAATDLASLAFFIQRQDMLPSSESGEPVDVHDLNWQRLTPWRELIAQLFSSAAGVTHLAALDGVTVHFGRGNTAQALLLLGWLGSRLGWQVLGNTVRNSSGRAVALTTKGVPGRRGEILRVELHSSVTGGSGYFAIERHDDHVITSLRGANLPTLTRTSLLHWPSTAELLQADISLRRCDTIFEQALLLSAKFAL